MANFKHLKSLDIQGQQTTRFTLYQVDGEPWLEIRPAAEVNRNYFNSLLKRSRKNLKRIRAGAVNAAQIAENRDEDRTLYPKHVVVGWGGVRNDEGVEVDFSVEDCAAFLRALPDWLFDELRVFASDVTNFLPEEEDPPLDAEVTGKP